MYSSAFIFYIPIEYLLDIHKTYRNVKVEPIFKTPMTIKNNKLIFNYIIAVLIISKIEYIIPQPTLGWLLVASVYYFVPPFILRG